MNLQNGTGRIEQILLSLKRSNKPGFYYDDENSIMVCVKIKKNPNGLNTAEVNIPDGYRFASICVGSFSEGTCTLTISGGKDLETLNTTECDNVHVNIRELSIKVFRIATVRPRDISLMGEVHTLIAYDLDIGDELLPESVRELRCWSLPENLDKSWVQKLNFRNNPHNSIPESAEEITCIGSNPGDLPIGLLKLDIVSDGNINLQDQCPNLRHLTVGIAGVEFFSVEDCPRTLESLEFVNHGLSVPRCDHLDLSEFVNMTELVMPTKISIGTFTPPPCLDVLTIEMQEVIHVDEHFRELISKIGYVNKIVARNVREHSFQVLTEFMFGVLFLEEMPAFDVSHSPFPVVILNTAFGCSNYTRPYEHRGLITIVDSPDNIYRADGDTIEINSQSGQYSIVGRETIDGPNGKLNVIHLIDQICYVPNAKSARK